MLSLLPFEQGHSAHILEQQGNEKGRKHGPVAFRGIERKTEDAEPEEGLAEVVRMARVTPEAALAEFALVRVRIFKVLLELMVGEGLHEETNGEKTNSHVVSPLEGN